MQMTATSRKCSPLRQVRSRRISSPSRLTPTFSSYTFLHRKKRGCLTLSYFSFIKTHCVCLILFILNIIAISLLRAPKFTFFQVTSTQIGDSDVLIDVNQLRGLLTRLNICAFPCVRLKIVTLQKLTVVRRERHASISIQMRFGRIAIKRGIKMLGSGVRFGLLDIKFKQRLPAAQIRRM